MIVYVDVIWLLNLIVDFLLLILTAFILKRKWKWYRISFGALLGSSMVFFSISNYAETMTHPIMKILFSFGIIFISFGFIKLKLFMKTLSIFYFSTFIVGGGIIGLHYLLESNISIKNGTLITISSGFGDPISWGFVCIMLPLLIYFSKNQIDGIEVRKIRYNELLNVEIKLMDKKIMVTGFVDSGNSLCDPLTQIPVMILDVSMISDFIPKWIRDKSMMENNVTFTKKEQKLPMFNRIRLIPYQVVGKKNQLLIALKPDYIKIIYPNNETIIVKALIGISHIKLSTENDFACLLHPKMLQKTSMFSA